MKKAEGLSPSLPAAFSLVLLTTHVFITPHSSFHIYLSPALRAAAYSRSKIGVGSLKG